MKFSTPYDHHTVPGLNTGSESQVRQSEQAECDINLIMQRFNRSGKLPAMQSLPPRYGDARVVDYQTALDIVNDAKMRFQQLPAETRKAFGNSPQEYLKALEDTSKENQEKLLKLGILVEKEPSEKQLLTELVSETKKQKKPENPA